MMAIVNDSGLSTTGSSGQEVVMLRGAVEGGDQRGRTLGFPTANVAIEQAAKLDGVWAGWVDVAGERHAAAISVGDRATFYGRNGFRLLEAHLIDFDGDLYNEMLTVWLHVKLREQRRFSSVDELIEQMHADVLAASEWASDRERVPTELDLWIQELPLGRALTGRVIR